MTPDDQRVRVPADVEREDRLLAGLTARQLAILAVPAVILWAAYLGLQEAVPLPVFVVVVVPVAVVVVTVALGRRDGLSLDRLLVAGWRQRRSARTLVPTDGDPQPAPRWAGAAGTPLPGRLGLPMVGVDEDGTITLGGDGTALVCRASTVNLALRTPDEQRALVAVFARYLNGLAAPVQIVVRARPVDLRVAVDRLRQAAGGLPHPALEAAALAHARFLGELAERNDLLHREVLVVLRDPGADAGAAGRLQRRAADANAALAGAGVTLTILDGDHATSVLAAAADPWGPQRPAGLAGPGTVITGEAP